MHLRKWASTARAIAGRIAGFPLTRIAVAAGLLAFLLLRINLDELASTFTQLRWQWVPVGVSLYVLARAATAGSSSQTVNLAAMVKGDGSQPSGTSTNPGRNPPPASSLLDRYSYVKDNPLLYTDPTGLCFANPFTHKMMECSSNLAAELRGGVSPARSIPYSPQLQRPMFADRCVLSHRDCSSRQRAISRSGRRRCAASMIVE